MVVGRNNGVVVLTGFSDKKMSGLLFGPQKSGRNNRTVVLTRWSYGGVPLYLVISQNLYSVTSDSDFLILHVSFFKRYLCKR